MNLTLSVDDDLVERAREAARQRGTSLNALIREYLEQLCGRRTGEEIVERLEELWERYPGRGDGTPFDRDKDAYGGRRLAWPRGR